MLSCVVAGCCQLTPHVLGSSAAFHNQDVDAERNAPAAATAAAREQPGGDEIEDAGVLVCTLREFCQLCCALLRATLKSIQLVTAWQPEAANSTVSSIELVRRLRMYVPWRVVYGCILLLPCLLVLINTRQQPQPAWSWRSN